MSINNTSTSELRTALPHIQGNAESKRQRFVRLANKRLEAAKEEIRLIRNLLENPYAYQYDYRDVQLMADELEKDIKSLRKYHRMSYLQTQ